MRLPAPLLAEWAFVRRRVLRTRLGLWLAVLTAGSAALVFALPHTPLAPHLARLGLWCGVLGVAFTAASEADRTVLHLILTHPATPARLLAARGGAVLVLSAAALAAAVVSIVPARALAPTEIAAAVAGGCGAAAAGIGAGLAAAAFGGTGFVGSLLAYLVLASPLPPEAWRLLVASPVVRTIGVAVLEVLPGMWRYRRLAEGDLLAWIHALLWAVGGVAVAAGRLTRRLR